MAMTPLTLAFLPNLGPMEIGLILVLGLLLFGRKLPEVGRNVGRSIVEFKRGLKDVSSELDAEARREETKRSMEAAGSKPSLSDVRSGVDEVESRRVSRADNPEPVSQGSAYSTGNPSVSSENKTSGGRDHDDRN